MTERDAMISRAARAKIKPRTTKKWQGAQIQAEQKGRELPGVVLKEKYLHPNVKDIKSHTKKKRDCVKIYLDTLLWQIKARQQRVLCRRGLNSFQAWKNETEWNVRGRSPSQARAWERECLCNPQGRSNVPGARVSGTLGGDGFLPQFLFSPWSLGFQNFIHSWTCNTTSSESSLSLPSLTL